MDSSKKSAKLTLKVKKTSGYTSTETVDVSLEQYSAIQEVLHDKGWKRDPFEEIKNKWNSGDFEDLDEFGFWVKDKLGLDWL